MVAGTTGDERYHYLVRALQPEVRAQVASAIEADPSLQIVRRIGPVQDPHTFVVSMSARDADALIQRFAGRLIVERDRPLQLFPDG